MNESVEAMADVGIETMDSEPYNSTSGSALEKGTQIVIMSWLSRILSDPLLARWLSWLLTPVVLAFILPMAILLFIWTSSLVLYIHRVHKRRLMRRLREAVNDRDIAKAGREIVAALWDAQGWLWHGYEVVGLEKIPDHGAALLVYYHGALPLDYYYLVAKVVLHKRRVIHSVVDTFLFRVPGFGAILSAFCCTPGTVASCASDLSDGNLLGLSPGGVYEALFSDHSGYKIMWKSRVGFAKAAIEANVPVIPVFTRNIREAVRTVGIGRRFLRALYNKIRLPCVPLYGGFPVKLTTYIGDPIPFDPSDTPETLKDKCKEALDALIQQHQRIPGSICMALMERVVGKRHVS